VLFRAPRCEVRSLIGFFLAFSHIGFSDAAVFAGEHNI
jgi:hypothetical protein